MIIYMMWGTSMVTEISNPLRINGGGRAYLKDIIGLRHFMCLIVRNNIMGIRKVSENI